MCSFDGFYLSFVKNLQNVSVSIQRYLMSFITIVCIMFPIAHVYLTTNILTPFGIKAQNCRRKIELISNFN